MTASDSTVLANYNTLAKVARSLADGDVALTLPLDGKDIDKAGVTMCLNLIAETCDMLSQLNDLSIEIDEFLVEPSLFALNVIVRSAKAVGTEG
jgi:hypothetical protein|nr:MAG TPA: hypothetical protein [Caudoviricetes sp.]